MSRIRPENLIAETDDLGLAADIVDDRAACTDDRQRAMLYRALARRLRLVVYARRTPVAEGRFIIEQVKKGWR